MVDFRITFTLHIGENKSGLGNPAPTEEILKCKCIFIIHYSSGLVLTDKVFRSPVITAWLGIDDYRLKSWVRL